MCNLFAMHWTHSKKKCPKERRQKRVMKKKKVILIMRLFMVVHARTHSLYREIAGYYIGKTLNSFSSHFHTAQMYSVSVLFTYLIFRFFSMCVCFACFSFYPHSQSQNYLCVMAHKKTTDEYKSTEMMVVVGFFSSGETTYTIHHFAMWMRDCVNKFSNN